MDGRLFRDLVGGRRQGIGAAALRSFLAALELPYSIVTTLRNRGYDHGLLRTHRLPVPVISVGNLTLGGTGKSPMVAWLGRFFLEQHRRPALISRGYGRAAEEVNDEFLELEFRLPTVPHVQDRDRVAAAWKLLRKNTETAVDVLILDDAFQHRRMARDLDIVLLDASEPFGFEHIFPRGTLRESVNGLRRAGMALLSRADLVSPEERESIRRRVLGIHPDLVWGEVVHRPKSLVSVSRDETELHSIDGIRALAFCGIGNPEAFRKTLHGCGVQVAELVSFPDHHRFSRDDLDRLETTARRLKVEAILCTMKDLVKIERPSLADLPIRAVLIDLEFLAGENAVKERLETISPRQISGEISRAPL